MKLTPDQMRHLSDLAGLNLTDQELRALTPDVNAVLAYLQFLPPGDSPEIGDRSESGSSALRPDVCSADFETSSLLDSECLANGYLTVNRLREIDPIDDDQDENS